jgi:hypothetical protein
MGGPGSTRWGRHQRAPLVEDAISLDLRILGRGGCFDERASQGHYGWSRDENGELRRQLVWQFAKLDERHGALGFGVTLNVEGGTENVVQAIELEAVPLTFGGQRARALRWYGRCPVEGPDGRRVLKVYLPPGRKRFACRHCHGLTYRSVQEHDARLDRLKHDPVACLRVVEASLAGACSPAWSRLAFAATWHHANNPERYRRTVKREPPGYGRGDVGSGVPSERPVHNT